MLLKPESVQLVKRDGTRNTIAGTLQPELFVTKEVQVIITEGDLLERTLPNGSHEIYEICEANYYPAARPIGPMFQCTLRRVSAP
jgi:hypothetical protein